MKTKKQEELIHSFLSELDDESKPLYLDIIMFLSELGYHPKKESSKISFKHDLHNKQMAKMGIRTTRKKGSSPFFSLRFSACNGYSQRFIDIVGSYITQYPARAAQCINRGCNFCAGEPETHVYTFKFSDSEQKSHCGAYAIEIPDITADDIAEIRKLIKEEHDYLMRQEVGAETAK